MQPHELARKEAEAFAQSGAIYRPLAASAVDPDHSPGVPTGLGEIDEILGGGYRVGFHLIVGYSHNGKTQLLLRTIWENRHRAMVYVAPDETNEMIICKLLSIATQTHVDEVFELPASTKAGLLKEHFPKLAVSDDFLNGMQILQLTKEVEQVFQERPAFIAYDYLEMFSAGRGQDQMGAIKSKTRAFKQLVKDTQLPWLVLHQLNRQGSKGSPVSMTDLTYGGEQEGTTITACWRQIFNPKLHAGIKHREIEFPTIHVSVIKNKNRPALNPDGVQYAIEPASGLIRPIRPGEKLMTRMSDLPGGGRA